jgi:phage-related protein
MVYVTNSGWVVLVADHRVEKEVASLSKDVQSYLLHIIEMIKEHGIEDVKMPYVKQISGKIWEMRVKGRDGIARALYVATIGKKVVILHAFVKKTQKTPQDAINLAIKRGKELGYL